jgi:hypothetical protein
MEHTDVPNMLLLLMPAVLTVNAIDEELSADVVCCIAAGLVELVVVDSCMSVNQVREPSLNFETDSTTSATAASACTSILAGFTTYKSFNTTCTKAHNFSTCCDILAVPLKPLIQTSATHWEPGG